MWAFFPRWLPTRSEQNAFGNLREFTLEVSIAAGDFIEAVEDTQDFTLSDP